jgi:hypothetical protein
MLVPAESHLADALRSSPVYALARARAASAQGRSWLARTGGSLPGLDMDVDSPGESRAPRAKAGSAKGDEGALVRAFDELEEMGAAAIAANSRPKGAEERPQAPPPSPSPKPPQSQPKAAKQAAAKAEKRE